MGHRWQIASFNDLTNTELYTLLRLRQEVFAVEQTSIYLDLDDKDQQAIHMLCWQGGELLAYQRLLPPGLSYPESSMGRIVVSPAARGIMLGRELVRKGIKHNLEQWPQQDICISAQAYLQRFYEDLGFKAIGDKYSEDGIPHIQMQYQRQKG